MDIAGKVALVTGGASGLGLATVRRLVTLGARVTVLDLASEAAARAIGDLGGAAVLVGGDVRDETAVQQAVDTSAEFGPLSIVVTCAGIATPARVVARDGAPFPLEVFRQVIEVNLTGTFNVIRLASAAMVSAPEASDPEERGVIITTASAAAFEGQIGQAAYAASKGGVVAMTLPIARELARHRIRVVSIAPGLFQTPMMAGFPEEAQKSLGAQVPHPNRLGDPEEYALLATQIITNPMLNGTTIRLDGALRMGAK